MVLWHGVVIAATVMLVVLIGVAIGYAPLR
jgi:hypothetical protein